MDSGRALDERSPPHFIAVKRCVWIWQPLQSPALRDRGHIPAKEALNREQIRGSTALPSTGMSDFEHIGIEQVTRVECPSPRHILGGGSGSPRGGAAGQPTGATQGMVRGHDP
jgi:hypothetical protein